MNTVMRSLLRFLIVISSISSSAVVLVVLQRSPCSNHLALLGSRISNGTTTTQVAAAASPSDDDADLSELLSRAAMEDSKTVIMTVTNAAWTAPGSLTDLFLESFRTGVRTEALLKHLLIVTLDAKSWEWCRRVHVHRLCYALDVGGANFSSEQPYMARNYVPLMWRRLRLQGRILELGYSFLLTDMDILWFRNPLLRVPVAADLAMSCDHFRDANPYDLDKDVNAGLVYTRASARTVQFYRDWYEARSLLPGKKTQNVLEKIKHQLTARLGVTLQFVDTAYFGGFCDLPRKPTDFSRLCTFHANCVIGLNNKVRRLRVVLDDWKQFKAAATNNGTTTLVTY